MTEHLDSVSLARYLGGGGSSEERAVWDTHLSECPLCREELVEARRIVAAAPGRRRAALVPLAAAAAVLLVVWTGTFRAPVERETRDPDTSPTLALAPRPLAPLGNVPRADRLLWTRVAGASRYRVTLFTSEGRAVWQTTTADTIAVVPDTTHLALAVPHYWQVKAELGFGRWVESELVTFTMTQTDAPR